MRTLLFIAGGLAGFLAAAPAFGQARKPQFQDYPVKDLPVTGQDSRWRVAPKLTPGTAAWQFRTRIREAAKQPPNFAGHFVLATWGCGAECLSSAIIDARNGAVYFTNFTACCWYNTPASGASMAHPEPVDVKEPIAFRLLSNLVVFAGLLNEEGSQGPHYFMFENGKLTPLR